ncbi:MAG: hypothetical protein GXY83_22335 [Rhodopirellula sp.]|nr:hypothetical protein [Rhodopirellula sp.]
MWSPDSSTVVFSSER